MVPRRRPALAGRPGGFSSPCHNAGAQGRSAGMGVVYHCGACVRPVLISLAETKIYVDPI